MAYPPPVVDSPSSSEGVGRRSGAAIAGIVVGAVLLVAGIVFFLLAQFVWGFWSGDPVGGEADEENDPTLLQPSAFSVTLDIGAGAGDDEYQDTVMRLIEHRVETAEIVIDEIGRGEGERIVVNLDSDADADAVAALFPVSDVVEGFYPVAAIASTGAAAGAYGAALSADDEQRFSEAVCPERGAAAADIGGHALLCDEEGAVKYLLSGLRLAADEIDAVSSTDGGFRITLSPGEATAFADLTSELATMAAPENQLALVVDGVVLTAPTVQGKIDGGVLEISGANTTADPVLAGHFALLARGASVTVVSS